MGGGRFKVWSRVRLRRWVGANNDVTSTGHGTGEGAAGNYWVRRMGERRGM